MQKFINLLQNLTSIPAIAGMESPLENFLVQFASERGLPFSHDAGYGVTIGNAAAKCYCIAHIDEVGGKINQVQGNIRFEGIGWVNPSLFAGREVEIITKEGIIPALAVGKEPLTTNYQSFLDLELIVDETQKGQICIGDAVRYRYHFETTPQGIFGTTLDNRIGVVQLLTYIENHLEDKKLFEMVAFNFSTEEEIKNKGAIWYMQKYMPTYFCIPDVMPHSLFQNPDISFKKPLVLEKTQDYELTSFFRELLDKNVWGEVEYLQSDIDLLKNSEPKKYQDITDGFWLSISTPVYNYHHSSYFVDTKTLENSNRAVYKIIDALYQKSL